MEINSHTMLIKFFPCRSEFDRGQTLACMERTEKFALNFALYLFHNKNLQLFDQCFECKLILS